MLRHPIRRNRAAQIRRADGVNHTCLEHVKVGGVNLLYGKRAVCVDGLAVGRDAHGKRMVVALGAESDVGDLDGAVLGNGHAGEETDGEQRRGELHVGRVWGNGPAARSGGLVGLNRDSVWLL